MHIWQTFNALFIIRCAVKYLIETGSEYQLLQHFEAISTESATVNTSQKTENDSTCLAINNEIETKSMKSVDGSKFESFFDAIVNLLIIIPVKYV